MRRVVATRRQPSAVRAERNLVKPGCSDRDFAGHRRESNSSPSPVRGDWTAPVVFQPPVEQASHRPSGEKATLVTAAGKPRERANAALPRRRPR